MPNSSQEAEIELGVVLGVDTHLDVHVAVALDQLGRRLDAISVSADVRGYGTLLGWAEKLGSVVCAGVEGTSSYGAGLARYLSRPSDGEAVTRGNLCINFNVYEKFCF